MPDVYLMRHAHVDYGEGMPIGANNPLTPLGVEMAERLAERATEWDLQYLFSSTMPRAQQTSAALLRRSPGLPYLEMDELRELYAADLQGYSDRLPSDDLRTWSPEEFRYANTRLYQRVRKGWKRIESIVAEGRLERVGVVAHGGTINMVLRQFQGIADGDLWSCFFELDWTSVTAIRYSLDGSRRFVLWVNDAHHIDGLRHRLDE